jgi:hypothetical protein
MSDGGIKLFVGNLPSDTTEAELQTLFEQYGTVKEVHVMSSARSRLGYACSFVVFKTGADVNRAISELNGLYRMRKDDDQAISVSYARADDDKQKVAANTDIVAASTSLSASANAAGNATASAANAANAAYATQYYAAQAAMIAPLMYGMSGNMGAANGQAALYGAYGMPALGMYAGYPMGYAYADMASMASMASMAQAYTAAASSIDPTAAAAAAAAAAAILPSTTQTESPPSPSATHEETKLFVGGLPPAVTEQEIRMVFGQLGTVKEVHIMQGRSQSGQACAFVVYPDAYSSQLAIRTLNKTPWHAAPEQPPIIVRAADKVVGKKGRSKNTKGQNKNSAS